LKIKITLLNISEVARIIVQERERSIDPDSLWSIQRFECDSFHNPKKRTWPLFWSNACCSHPRKGQECAAAATDRLLTELGIRDVSVDLLFKFEYRAQYDDNWGEHELDWVYRSRCNAPGNVNPDEINDWQFIWIDDLKSQVLSNPGKFTLWFRICLGRVLAAS
jgi:isopentenyl-diphosphate delta-isomerase type 1